MNVQGFNLALQENLEKGNILYVGSNTGYSFGAL
jgi:hypothetical protein